MDIHEFIYACRKGDLTKVKYLVETKEVEINFRDRWDSTPLYYACLCGHIDIVKYLLENGAKCEANTFDGERCLYGALNTDIRSLLRSYKVITSKVIRRDVYHEFLRRLLETGDMSDICFRVHGEEFYAHKCVLATRSEYFYEKFLSKWRLRDTVVINNAQVNSDAFYSILRYLYTGRFEININDVSDGKRLAKQCRLPQLILQIDQMMTKTELYQMGKPGMNVNTLVIEQSDSELQRDMGVLADESMPIELANWADYCQLPFVSRERAPFADVIFSVDGHEFLCHKAIFCARSEYFRTLLRDPFGEQSSNESNMPVFVLRDIRASVFVSIIYYVYQESTEFNSNDVYDVLVMADLFLLPGLKRLAGGYIGQFLDLSNVVPVVRLSRQFDLHRLEELSYEFCAKNLENLVENPEFHQLILDDAAMVKQRHTTDSIDVVDNIRYHLTATTITEAPLKLELIEDLLIRLGLDA